MHQNILIVDFPLTDKKNSAKIPNKKTNEIAFLLKVL
jgi:hypothetical protein